MVNDAAQLFTVDLNGAVHVFDDSVATPLELCECVRPECGSATWCNRDHTHVALPILVNCMRNPIRETAIGSEPVVWSALRTAADHCNASFPETLPDGLKIVLGNLGVGVHQADVVVTAYQLGYGREARKAMGLSNVLWIPDYIYIERAGNFSRTVTRSVIDDVNIRRQNASSTNAFQRFPDAHGFILCRKQHAEPFHN